MANCIILCQVHVIRFFFCPSSKFIIHYLLLNKYSYLFAIVCIFVVNYLQVEIPRFIQLAVDLLNESTTESKEGLLENVQWVIALSVVMVVVRILSRMLNLKI